MFFDVSTVKIVCRFSFPTNGLSLQKLHCRKGRMSHSELIYIVRYKTETIVLCTIALQLLVLVRKNKVKGEPWIFPHIPHISLRHGTRHLNLSRFKYMKRNDETSTRMKIGKSFTTRQWILFSFFFPCFSDRERK